MTSLVFKYDALFCEQVGLDPYGRDTYDGFNNTSISHFCPDEEEDEDGDQNRGPIEHMKYNGNPAVNLYIRALKGYPLCDMIYLSMLRDRNHMFHEFTYSCHSDKEELMGKIFGICLRCKSLKELVRGGLKKGHYTLWSAFEYCIDCVKPLDYEDFEHLFKEIEEEESEVLECFD